MVYPAEVRQYVLPTPVSLEILRNNQTKEDQNLSDNPNLNVDPF
jgi:hypothetical protein